jgi:arsenite-transporting ATPase
MKILFFTGKGGVGKSTMSAAGAWQLSQKSRVLLVSLDPAHNLGDIFNITLNQKKTPYTSSLFLKEIDLQKLSRDYLKREINVLSNSYSYLQTLNLDNYFSVLRYSPGIEEYALLTSIEETIRNETEFDYIIFDTPPTGLTLRFLALPRVTITWIDRLIQIRQKILEKRYTIQKIRGPLKEGEENPEIVLAYDEKDDDVLKRLRRLNDNYQGLTKTLEGKDCSIVLVFNPDILSLKESQRLIEGLNDLNLPLRLMIDNKVTEENTAMADQVEETIKMFARNVPVERIYISSGIVECTDGKLCDIPEDIASKLLQQCEENV